MAEELHQGLVAMVYEYVQITFGKEATKRFMRLFLNLDRKEANRINLKYWKL